MIKLEGEGAYQNYNAHFIPVISTRPRQAGWTIYYPCAQGQIPAWDEIVVFDKSQTLPRFWVEMCADITQAMTISVVDLSNQIDNLLGNIDKVQNLQLIKVLENKKGILGTFYSSDEGLTDTELRFYQLTVQLLTADKKVNPQVAQQVIDFTRSSNPSGFSKDTKNESRTPSLLSAIFWGVLIGPDPLGFASDVIIAAHTVTGLGKK